MIYRVGFLIAAALAASVPLTGVCGSDEGNAGDHPALPNAQPDTGDESTPTATPLQPAAPLVSGSRVLWFVPSDHDASTTCLSFANTAPSRLTVRLDGYDLSGALSGNWLIDVPGKSSVRACSDAIASSPPPSWSSLVIVNFTDFVAYVKATLPPGVQIDGFVVNTGGAAYDPRASYAAMMELEFRPDVATTTQVQFSPQDNDANATCLFFYNTSTVAATAQINGYGQGVLVYQSTVSLAAGAMVRACSDALAASPPPSWAAMQTVNFTDFTERAEITLPSFVKVEGYVLWNPGTGVVDPRAAGSNFLRLRIEANPEYDNIFADGFE